MQVLVLLNLVFVHMTGAAGMHWLAPLYVLTLGAPLMQRHREARAYRALWNAGVIGFFLLLLRHAQRAELANVLEDGLVLAVLCQVHLLNNLRSTQRPDLLFFNAFLIAIVGGFIHRGIGFPIAFFVFAPCFVVGLQLLNATRGGRVLPAPATRSLVADGARRAAVLLASSFLVFLFWPRDFEREALLHDKLEFSKDGASELEVGFSEELVLERRGSVRIPDGPALRVRLLAGERSEVSSLWRGAVLDSIRAGKWRAAERLNTADEPWRGQGHGLVRARAGAPEGARVEVVRLDPNTKRLFAPLWASRVQLAPRDARHPLHARAGGALDTAHRGEVRYELGLTRASAVELGGVRPTQLPVELAAYVELPAGRHVRVAKALAARLAKEATGDTEQHDTVALVEGYLARTYRYLPPGSAPAARTLDEFLEGRAGGHCEFFAAALATMLRSLGIPCRVVTGYRSSRWDSAGEVLLFGLRDAHAWVEVWDPRAGWYAVDPSPLPSETAGGASSWARLRARAHAAWDAVTSFDSARRAELFAWLTSLPARVVESARERPLAALLAGGLGLLCFTWCARRKRRRSPPSVYAYRRALRRADLRLLPGETPRELVARARSRGLADARVAALEEATRLHEAERYAA